MTTTTLAPIPDALLTEAFAALMPTLLATPHEALALSDLRTVLATSVWHRDSVTLSHLEITHLDHALATYATGHGWTYVPFLQNPRSSTHSAAYLRPLLPDLSRLEARLASYFATNQRVPYAYEVLHAGLTVAFPAGVREDPDGVLPVAMWNHLLAPHGFHWNGDPDSLLTPLLPELSPTAGAKIQTVLATLPRHTYYRDVKHKDKGEGIPVVLAQDLLLALTDALQWSPLLRALPVQAFLDHPDLRRVLVALGWSPQPLHAHPYQIVPTPPGKGEAIALAPALHFRLAARPTEIAPGFFPQITKFVTHNETLIYLEIAGPKTTLKASRAHLLGNRRHILMERELLLSKEDGLQTIRTPLPCGWEQWAIFHRQLSPRTATPDPFYLLDDGTTTVPPLFATLLAKALPLPTLPEWTPYLWLEGRLAGLIHPIPATQGIGAWGVATTTAKWQAILQSGIADDSLTF